MVCYIHGKVQAYEINAKALVLSWSKYGKSRNYIGNNKFILCHVGGQGASKINFS